MDLVNKRLSEDFTCRDRFPAGHVLDLVYEDSNVKSRIRKFTGLCISTKSIGFGFRHILRNVVNNVCVEVAFDGSSTIVVSLSKASIYKEVSNRKAKLYYLRTKRSVDSKV